MSSRIVNKIKNAITTHPTIAMFGIGLAITFGITMATGLISPEQAFASRGGGCTSC